HRRRADGPGPQRPVQPQDRADYRRRVKSLAKTQPSMTHTTRRTLLRGLAAGLGNAAGGWLLAACGAGSADRPVSPTSTDISRSAHPDLVVTRGSDQPEKLVQ